MSEKDEIFEMSEEEGDRVDNLNDKDEENEKMGQVKSKVKKLTKGRKKAVQEEDAHENEDLDFGDEKQFICGVVEGFYGRPWTTGQRKELFRRMKLFGMNTYLYGPKDDYKHRLYWRELYSADEADLLKLLIDSAQESNITFIYAISPGLDMIFASPKEITLLKEKLLQVQSLGCKAFALLFDDIDPILCATDKEQFKSAASAQAKVTNQMYEALGGPRFLFCPTEYCNSMAVPDVLNSLYLKTLGKELNRNIPVMWTGPKVVSKNITVESIKQLTGIVRRKVVIWDNIHANDYDPKRIFLGPYKGRSTDLIPHLVGVLTNPNCEFESNFIAMHTLTTWWRSYQKKEKTNAESSEETKKSDVEMDEAQQKEEEKPEKEDDAITDEQKEVVESNEGSTPDHVHEKEEDQETQKQQEAKSATSSVDGSMVGSNDSDDSETDSDYLSHEEFYSLRRRPLSPPFDHGVYNPDEALKLAIEDWIPFFSATKLGIAKPIARSGPPLGMPPQYDSALVTNAPMVPMPSTTNILSNDPIPSVGCTLISDKIPINVNEKIQNSEPKNESNSESTSVIDLEQTVSPGDVTEDTIDVEMSSMPPSIGSTESPDTGSVKSERKADDIDMKSIGENSEVEKDREEVMQIGDAEIMTSISKQSEMQIQMETEDEEVMQFDTQTDTDVPMATVTSGNTEKDVKDDVEQKELPTSEMSSPTVAPLSSPLHLLPIVPNQLSFETPEMGQSGFKIEPMTKDDVRLAVELFYLPYEHGSIGLKMVKDFLWLQRNVQKAVVPANGTKAKRKECQDKALEWMERALQFEASCVSIHRMCNKLTTCSNRPLLYDLFPYFWDIKGVVSMLSSYVKWMGQFYLRHMSPKSSESSETESNQSKPASPVSDAPPSSISSPQLLPPAAAWLGSDPEPWAFRGGLSGEFQRLLPITMANDLFCQVLPCSPHTSNTIYVIRPYLPVDEKQVYKICLSTGNDGTDYAEDFSGYEDLPGEKLVGALLTLSPEFCFVVEDDDGICGYLVGTADAKAFWKKYSIAYHPELKEKYKLTSEDNEEKEKLGDEVKRFIEEIQSDADPYSYSTESLHVTHPSYMQIAVHRRVTDPSIAKSMTVCMLSALKSHGSTGVHTTVRSSDCYMPDLYARLGFHEIRPSDPSLLPSPTTAFKEDSTIVFGRAF